MRDNFRFVKKIKHFELDCYLDFGKVFLLWSVSRFDDDDEVSIGELSVSLIRPQGAAQLIDDEHGDVQNLFFVSSEIVKKNQGVAF
jgi:hypothetical protein